jgi:hypothetical protein
MNWASVDLPYEPALRDFVVYRDELAGAVQAVRG